MVPYTSWRVIYHLITDLNFLIVHNTLSIMMTALSISYDSEPSRPPPADFQDHENDAFPCISYDSGANRPRPGRFQNHENDNSPMHFL